MHVYVDKMSGTGAGISFLLQLLAQCFFFSKPQIIVGSLPGKKTYSLQSISKRAAEDVRERRRQIWAGGDGNTYAFTWCN